MTPSIEELIRVVAQIEARLAAQQRALRDLPPDIAQQIRITAQILTATTIDSLAQSKADLVAARARLA
ncbi:hypothetical protein [Roseococcus sp. YIM B11640]|uniref:hypothetical protein n=1 Tax=Roseococcus sp. YIM B11640 TaxID=3133973 RepID=UPI003C7D0D9B